MARRLIFDPYELFICLLRTINVKDNKDAKSIRDVCEEILVKHILGESIYDDYYHPLKNVNILPGSKLEKIKNMGFKGDKLKFISYYDVLEDLKNSLKTKMREILEKIVELENEVSMYKAFFPYFKL